MASSSNQNESNKGNEKSPAAEGGTIWGLGPVRSRMTQNALGDNFVDQFQDNSQLGDNQSNVSGSQIPIVKVEPENKSESSFGNFFKKIYPRSSGLTNGITRTVTTFPEHRMSATTFPDQRMSATSFPEQRMSATTFPDQRMSATSFPEQRMSATSFPEQRMSATTFQDQRMSSATRLVQGELTGVGMYPGTSNHQNWEMIRGMGGGGDLIGMRRSSDLSQSRDDEEFRFRMALLERENSRPPSVSNSFSDVAGQMRNPFSDVTGQMRNPFSAAVGQMTSNSISGVAGQMSLEEIERQKLKTEKQLKDLQQLEHFNKVKQFKQRMEMEDQIRRREIELEAQRRRKAMEDEEMMKLIESEAIRKQERSRQTENSGSAGVDEKSGQNELEELKRDVEILKRQANNTNVPARSGVKYRLGVKARLGDPKEGKTVFSRLGHDSENKDDTGEFDDTPSGKVETRWKRGSGDDDFTLNNHPSKKRKHNTHALPADLVLTEISDEGPVAAQAAGGIPRELVLTEFGENGPVKVQTELEKLEARARKVSKDN